MGRFVILSCGWLLMLTLISGCESEQRQAAKGGRDSEVVTEEQPAIVTEEPEDLNVGAAPAQQPAESPATLATGQEPPEVETTTEQESPPQAEPNEPNEGETQKISAEQFGDKFAEILQSYVGENGLVDYKTLSRRKLELLRVLNEFEQLDREAYESWSREDKIAFWLNAYNLNMLRIILDNYPIQSSRVLRIFWPPNSIRHIKGIWSEYKFIVMDEQFTLNEIDNRFFRKQFDDPRIFFGISYASMSSPALRNEPYYGNRLWEQLDEQVKRFVAREHGVRIDRENGKVYLSPVLKQAWYGKYFVDKFGTDRKFKDQTPTTSAVLNFLTNYLPQRDVSFLETGSYSVEYLKFDWTLNES